MLRMEYDQLKNKFRNGNMIKSLTDGIVRKYSGFLTMVGISNDAEGFDSINNDLVVYKNGCLAEIVDQGIDENEEHLKHIDNVLRVCRKLGCTPTELLKKDYIKELS